MMTNNGPNYKVVGRMITKKYVDIYWSPCVVHCIKLIIKDIVEMPTIQS